MDEDTPGYPEVQAIVSAEVERAVREARQRLWADVKLETEELRDEIRSLREQVASALVEGGTLG